MQRWKDLGAQTGYQILRQKRCGAFSADRGLIRSLVLRYLLLGEVGHRGGAARQGLAGFEVELGGIDVGVGDVETHAGVHGGDLGHVHSGRAESSGHEGALRDVAGAGSSLKDGCAHAELGGCEVGGDLDGFLQPGDVAANRLGAFRLATSLAVQDSLNLRKKDDSLFDGPSDATFKSPEQKSTKAK